MGQGSFCWLSAFIHSGNLCNGFKTLRFYFRTQDDQKLHHTEEKVEQDLTFGKKKRYQASVLLKVIGSTTKQHYSNISAISANQIAA